MTTPRPVRTIILTLALLTAPLAAAAQPAGRVYQLGWLAGVARASAPELEGAFREALREFGWVEGQNLRIVFRSADGHLDRLPDMAADLVRLKVDVILASVPAALAAARNATTSVPIVMVFGPDPGESGLVASLARPGGNITGLTSVSDDLSLKQLEVLQQMVPGRARVAVLWNRANPWHGPALERVEAAARALGLGLQVVGVRAAEEFDGAFADMARRGVGAVLVLPDPLTFQHRARLGALAVRHGLPTMNGLVEYTRAGGLASYWPNSAGGRPATCTGSSAGPGPANSRSSSRLHSIW